MYPATANTELNGSLSIVDDVSDGGTKAIQFDNSDAGNYLEWMTIQIRPSDSQFLAGRV